MVAHTGKLIEEAEAGALEFEASLGYIARVCLQREERKEGKGEEKKK